MKDRPTLPAPGRISIDVLKLSPSVEQALRAAEIHTVGHLFRPTVAQQAQLRAQLAGPLHPAGVQEVVKKARDFYRAYRKTAELLAETEGARPAPAQATVEQELKEQAAPIETASFYQWVPIDVLGLSADAYNALHGAGITQIGQLRDRLAGESRQLREVRLSLHSEIERKLADFLAQPLAFQELLAQRPDESPSMGTDAPLEALTLSRSIIRALESAGIETIAELNTWTDEELAAITFVGPWRVRGIRSAVAEFGEGQLEAATEAAQAPKEPAPEESGADSEPAGGIAVQEEEPASEIEPPAEAALADVPLAALSIPGQARAGLEAAGVETAHDLAEMSDAELGEISYVADAVIARIRHQVDELRAEYGREATAADDKPAPLPDGGESSIAVLNLSTAASHRLRRVGIKQLADLVALSHAELLHIRNIGPALAEEIEEKLEAYLGQSVEEVRATQRVQLVQVPDTVAHASEAHLQAPIESLDLSARAYNVLANAGLETVGDLLRLPAADLAELEGAGSVTLSEIRQKRDDFLARPVPVEPPEPALPALPEADLPDVLAAWFDLLIDDREREIIENRYGLFAEGQTLETLGEKFKVTRERIRQIQIAALDKLERDLEPIAPLFGLVRQELSTTDGVLPVEHWAGLLHEQPFALGGIRPHGLLEVLADLKDDWIIYAIGEGVLFADVSSRAEAVERLAAWQSRQQAEAAATPTQPQAAVGKEKEASVAIAFAPDYEAVMHNVRQWNRDLDAPAGKKAWGQRTVTYFGYDPQSNAFAPSKFCAYVPAGRSQRRIPWLTVAVYTRIDREDPIFDGQRARLHLTDTLNFALATPKQGTALRHAFDVWALAHSDSVTVHPRGPQLLLPKAVLLSLQEELEQEESVVIQPPVEPARISPEGKPRPQTRKVTAADLASIPTPTTAAQQGVAEDNPFYKVEVALREQLGKVDLIGELAIGGEQFKEWCELVQTHAIEDGKFRPRQIPPAAFVVQMVFAARNSEEEARNFWQPYAKMVWGLEEASAYFQLRCRNRFKQAIAFLSEQYDLFFPQRSAGDLVRPIYRHAIIPAYLEREFVDWLKRQWSEILETPEGFLIPQLRRERSLNYLSPTLRNFIQGADTAETAAALIRNMATAASLHAEGESLADVYDLLAGSPIEQSLWDELSQAYVDQAAAGERRRLSHRLEWVWSLEAGEMQLRLRNLHLAGDVVPYQAVWVAQHVSAAKAVLADVYETLDPWEVDGEWLVDEVVFPPEGPADGKLMVLGDDDSLLWAEQVPPLPGSEFQFFRLTKQEVYAVPVAADKVQAGQYLVARKAGVRLVRPEGNLEAISTPMLPFILQDRFETADIYEILLPLTILHQGTEIETLMPSGSAISGEPPYIYGEEAVAGLSSRVPPLYRSDAIWLVIPGASERLLAQGSFEVRPQKGKTRRRGLREMATEIDEAGVLWVPLSPLVDRRGGTYTVELRRGLRSLLAAPLQFSFVPGIEVQPPAQSPAGARVYTPNNPPVVRIRSVRPEQIGNRERLTVTTGADGWLEVAWKDLRGGCRLPLAASNQQVPLEWPVDYFHAWVAPAPEGNALTWEMVAEATLHATGTPEIVEFFFVQVGDNVDRRQLSLDRHGRVRLPIRKDHLFDVLRLEEAAETPVYVSVFGERWPLFTLRRHPHIHKAQVSHDPERSALIFENDLAGAWPGDYQFQVHQLSNPSAKPQVLQQVLQLEASHLIPCDLADGIYQFEVWDPGAERALAKAIFGVGKVERSAFFDEAVRLLESLSHDTAHRLPRWLGGDMIRFLAAEAKRTAEGQAELAPEWLWQLALLQPRAYAGAAEDELEALWSPLLRFRQVDNVGAWEQAHGLLPDWAVMPSQLVLRFVPFGNSIDVEPAVLSRKGRRGIGYCVLKMGEEHRHVYVTWDPHHGERVSVTLGLPDRAPDEVDYVQLDALDMYPVYQCQQCGWFVASSIAPDVREKHSHRREKPQLEDVLNHPGDYRPLAEITPKRREDIRDYRLAPDYFLNRRQIYSLLHSPEIEVPNPVPNLHPLGREAYLYASTRWVARYRQSSEAARGLQELVGVTKRRQAFDRLAAYLAESRWFDVGAWGALGRFLAAFPWERDEPLVNVDRYTLLLALLARTRVHARSRAHELRTQCALTDIELAEMLQVLNRYCPELVAWAFNWVELFFLHAAG